MVVKTSEDVYNFVKECIKIKEKHECTTTSKQCTEKPEEKIIPHDKLQKYNLDYSKFDECIQELENEEELEKEKKKQNENYLNGTHPCSQGHDHSKERQLYEKNTSEKLTASHAFNEEGKQAFHEKKYKLACVYFRKGLIQLDYCFPESEQEQKQYDTLEINLHLNLALTKFHMANYHDCINECNTVLNIDKNNAKAFYRKGQAYMQLDLYEEAKGEFVKASAFNPNDTNVRNAILTLKKKVEAYNQKKKLVCSKMFLSNETESHTNKKEQTRNELNSKVAHEVINEEESEIKKKENHTKQTEDNNNNNNNICQNITNICNKIECQKDVKSDVKNNITSENGIEFVNNIQSILMKNIPLNVIICSTMFLCSVNLFFPSRNYAITSIMAFSILCFMFLKPFFK